MSTILSLLVNALAACFSWFDRLLSAVGGVDIVLAGIIIFLVSRFLLGPLIGSISGGSDKAKRVDKDEE